MTVTADAENLQVDPARFHDPLFIPVAERRIIAGRARRDVDVLRLDIHVLEKILLHEVAVTLWMIAGEANIFIEVERHHPREIELATLVHSHQLLVEPEWRRSRRHPQHGVGFGVE